MKDRTAWCQQSGHCQQVIWYLTALRTACSSHCWGPQWRHTSIWLAPSHILRSAVSGSLQSPSFLPFLRTPSLTPFALLLTLSQSKWGRWQLAPCLSVRKEQLGSRYKEFRENLYWGLMTRSSLRKSGQNQTGPLHATWTDIFVLGKVTYTAVLTVRYELRPQKQLTV